MAKRNRKPFEYQPKRVDENQPAIVATFRKLGCMVQLLHTVGDGCYDVVIAVDFLNVFVEIKNYKKPPSARALTPAQKKWNFAWTGLRAVVTTEFEAVRLVDSARKLVAKLRISARESSTPIRVTGCAEKMYQPQLY